MVTSHVAEQILAHKICTINTTDSEKPQKTVKKHSTRNSPFVKSGNVTGIALEFFIGQLGNRLIPRAAADFLAKICNVAASSDAYQLYYSKATMAERAGVSQKSVQRYMRTIEASGIVTRTAVTDSIRGHQPNVYTFTPAFLSAVKDFFTNQLNANQLKNLRAVAQREVSALIENALSTVKKCMQKVATLDAVKSFFESPPRGQIDPSPIGQIDLQEVVIHPEVVSKNLARKGSPPVVAHEVKTITGQERRVMTRDALTRSRTEREKEKGIELRETFARRQRATHLSLRGLKQAFVARQESQTSYNHSRIEAEGKKHDQALALAAEKAQKDPAVVSAHLAKIRSLFSKNR